MTKNILNTLRSEFACLETILIITENRLKCEKNEPVHSKDSYTSIEPNTPCEWQTSSPSASYMALVAHNLRD
jgi:hypothetical protein